MEPIEIILTETLRRGYRKLPASVKAKFKKQLKLLSRDPRHPSLKIHRIKDHWEFYVDRHYRCLFQQEGSVYTLKNVGRHDLIDRF
jgi:mRNA interferase RelE/StbE